MPSDYRFDTARLSTGARLHLDAPIDGSERRKRHLVRIYLDAVLARRRALGVRHGVNRFSAWPHELARRAVADLGLRERPRCRGDEEQRGSQKLGLGQHGYLLKSCLVTGLDIGLSGPLSWPKLC